MDIHVYVNIISYELSLSFEMIYKKCGKILYVDPSLIFIRIQYLCTRCELSYRNTCIKWIRYRSIVRFSWIRRVNHESVPFRLLWGHGTKRHSKCKISKNLILEVIAKICMHVGRGRGSFCLSINPPPPF